MLELCDILCKMKAIVGFITIILSVVSARNGRHMKLEEWKGYKEGDRYFYFAGDDGKVHLVDSKEPADEHAIQNYTCCPKKHIQYWLYTRDNPKNKQVLVMGNKKSVSNSNFDYGRTTIFTAHGWLGDGNTQMNKLLTKVFLEYQDVNVIVLDWSVLSKLGYVTARFSVPKVGRMYGQFINWLRTNFRLNLNYIHLVGHSLGGHLVGIAGKELRGQAKRITALDPAGPLWYPDKKNRIAYTDGRYVEVIHTNAYKLGYPYASGHADFYPNGGKRQVGCGYFDVACHHKRSWELMAASINNDKFYSRKCRNFKEALNQRCPSEWDDNYLMGNSWLWKFE